MAQSDRDIYLTDDQNVKVNIEDKGQTARWSAPTALSNTEVRIKNNGGVISVSGTPKIIIAGGEYLKSSGSWILKAVAGNLTVVRNTTYSGDMQISVESPLQFVWQGLSMLSHRVTITGGGGYNTTMYKLAKISGSVKLATNGAYDTTTTVVVGIGTANVQVEGDTNTAIIEPNKDVFYVSTQAGVESEMILDLWVAGDTAEPSDLATINGFACTFQSSSAKIGNIDIITTENASDSAFFLKGEIAEDAKLNPSPCAGYSSYLSASGTSTNTYFARQTGVKASDFVVFNETDTEEHLCANAFVVGTYTTDAVSNPDIYDATFEIPEGKTLGDICGVIVNKFAMTTSTQHDNNASIVLTQALPFNETDINKQFINFDKHECIASIQWKDPKKLGDVKMYRAIYQPDQALIKYILISSTLTPTQILALGSDDIYGVRFTFIKANTTFPVIGAEGANILNNIVIALDVTKSITAGTPPTIGTRLVSGSTSYPISLVGIDVLPDYVTATFIKARVLIGGLFSSAIVSIAPYNPWRATSGQLMGYAGVSGEVDATPIFTAKGGNADVRPFVLPNVTGTYIFSINVLLLQSSIFNVDYLVAYGDNDTNLDFTLGCEENLSTGNLLANIITEAPLPVDSLPLSYAVTQTALAGDITAMTVVSGNTSIQSNGWNPNSPKQIFNVNAGGARTNSMQFIWANAGRPKLNVYKTRTPINPTADPSGFFDVSYNSTEQAWFVTARGHVGTGYFNDYTVFGIVVTSGNYLTRCALDINSVNIIDNTAYIKAFNSDGSPLDINDVIEFGITAQLIE